MKDEGISVETAAAGGNLQMSFINVQSLTSFFLILNVFLSYMYIYIYIYMCVCVCVCVCIFVVSA